jgi:hypothetical protein
MMESSTTTHLSLLAKEVSDAFTLDLERFFKVFDTSLIGQATETETHFLNIQASWTDLIALSQDFQTAFLPDNLNIAQTDETEPETPKSQKPVSKKPIQKPSTSDFREPFFPITENRKSELSDFKTESQTGFQTPNQTDFQTSDVSNSTVSESNQGNSADDTAAIWQKPLGNLGNLTRLNPNQTDNAAIWQKPLGKLGNLTVLSDFENDSTAVEPTDSMLFENVPQNTTTNSTFEQKSLKHLAIFTDLTKTPMESAVFPTTNTQNKDFPTESAVFPITDAENNDFLIETNHSKMEEWLPKLQQPIHFEKQASVQNTLPSDDSTMNHAFLPKADEDTTVQTDTLLDALTQRVIQEFKRFYP